MKKTLVALAVLAASGASFAQVAITGAVAMGWSGSQDAAGNQFSGLGVDTATLDFAVTEDLGGGLKLTAHQGFDTLARTGVVGGDTGMTLGTSTFVLALDSKQYADYLQGGNANVSGTFNSFEGRILGNKQNKDAAGIAFMVTPAITLSVTEYESTAGLGLGQGGSGAPGSYFGTNGTTAMSAGTGSRNTQYQIAYKSGALGADAAYKAYDSSSTSGSAYSGKSITRAAVSYDFGVAKVGGGVTAVSLINGGTDTQSVLSASVPFGAVSFGAQFVNRNVNGSVGGAATDFNQGGYGLELDYNFSKSTKLAVNYLSWQQVAGVNGAIGVAPGLSAPITTPTAGYAGTNSTLTEIALVKSF